MSEPTASPFRVGILDGVNYDFASIGDTLPTHSHVEGESHITICRTGKIKAFGPGWERVLVPGDVIKFDPNKEHALQAIEAPSRVTNIRY